MDIDFFFQRCRVIAGEKSVPFTYNTLCSPPNSLLAQID